MHGLYRIIRLDERESVSRKWSLWSSSSWALAEAGFATITQARRTGGVRFLKPINIQLDPGPGALVNSYSTGVDPRRVRAILVSHAHPDHYGDAEVFIEAMTAGATRKRGVLAAPRSVLRGNEICGPGVSKYHQKAPSRVIEVKAEDRFEAEGVEVHATPTRHTDPDTVGFLFKFPQGEIAYTSDTEPFPGIGQHYRKVKLLILAVLRPRGDPCQGHMAADEAVRVVKEAEPETCIITAFGAKLIYRNPGNEAKYIAEMTGVPTIAATDFMRVQVGTDIKIQRKERAGLMEFIR